MANKKQKPPRELSKHQKTRWEREQRRHRYIFIGGISLIVAVVLLVSVGFYWTELRPLWQTVIEVNGTKFNMDYFTKVFEYVGQGQSADQLQSDGGYAATLIVQDELIYQGAKQLGVTATSDEINQELKKENIGSTYRDIARANVLVDKLKTNDYFTSKVTKSVPQVNILAMFLESDSVAADIRSQIENAADQDQEFKTLAAAQSLDSYTKQNSGAADWHPQDILKSVLGSSVPGDYAFSSDVVKGDLSQPRPDTTKTKSVGYWIVNVPETKTDPNGGVTYHVQEMLLPSLEVANQVYDQLKAGADFVTLGKQYSQFKGAADNGGDIGFATGDSQAKVVNDYITSHGINEISPPLKDDTVTTTGGSWLIKVDDKSDARDLSTDDYNYQITNQVTSWLTGLQTSATIVNKLADDPALAQFALNKVTKDLGL